ncbi:hypothetical protein GCM10020000_04260 [Streptomyces olivoverticillatus]
MFKFASCDGCQLTLLDCEDELLPLADEMDIAHFVEASSDIQPGPYDLSLVEGSVSTPEHLERIRRIRTASRYLVTIGACATAERCPGPAQLRRRRRIPRRRLRRARLHRVSRHLHPPSRPTSPSTSNCAAAPSTADS